MYDIATKLALLMFVCAIIEIQKSTGIIMYIPLFDIIDTSMYIINIIIHFRSKWFTLMILSFNGMTNKALFLFSTY